MASTPLHPPFALRRRHVIGGALAATTVALWPWKPALPVEADAQAAFMSLSVLLTGRATLDPVLGRRLLGGLQASYASFNQHAADLLGLLQTRKVALPELPALLAAEKPVFAAFPSQVMAAWYLGVVGDGPQARVVAFEHALNAATVADKLKPPTYAYGVPGSWSANPNA